MTRAVEAGGGSEFLRRFNGGFTGVLHWYQLDQLWERLRAQASSAWHVYAIGETPPSAPADAQQLDRFITELDALLRAEHHEDYCGLVYVDSRDDPTLIKIFDPNNLGSCCGSSGMRVLPGWVLSLAAPLDLQAAMPVTRSRRRWWNSLFPG